MLSKPPRAPLATGRATGAGAAAATLCLRLWLGSLRRARELPRLDPLKVAVLLALVLAPLQDGGAAASLRGAWQVMLGE